MGLHSTSNSSHLPFRATQMSWQHRTCPSLGRYFIIRAVMGWCQVWNVVCVACDQTLSHPYFKVHINGFLIQHTVFLWYFRPRLGPRRRWHAVLNKMRLRQHSGHVIDYIFNLIPTNTNLFCNSNSRSNGTSMHLVWLQWCFETSIDPLTLGKIYDDQSTNLAIVPRFTKLALETSQCRNALFANKEMEVPVLWQLPTWNLNRIS